MVLFYLTSFTARLRDGGVAGGDRTDRYRGRPSRFAPTPRGSDTARLLRS